MCAHRDVQRTSGRARLFVCLTVALVALGVGPSAGQARPGVVQPEDSTWGVNAAARTPFAKGLAAAQRRDWKDAVQTFSEAQRADPDAPQIWFNLGLACSQVFGYELRAVGWLGAYLVAVPNDPRADVIRRRIAGLQASFEGLAGTMVEALETVPPVVADSAYRITPNGSDSLLSERVEVLGRARSVGVTLTAVRILLGDTARAFTTLEATVGISWPDLQALFDDDNCLATGSVRADAIVDALALTGQIPTRKDVWAYECGGWGAYRALMERSDFSGAERLVIARLGDYEYADQGRPFATRLAEDVACAAFALHDSSIVTNAVAEAVADSFLNLGFMRDRLTEAQALYAKAVGLESLNDSLNSRFAAHWACYNWPDRKGQLVALGRTGASSTGFLEDPSVRSRSLLTLLGSDPHATLNAAESLTQDLFRLAAYDREATSLIAPARAP
ncbi:MAG TPA: hypothetical protein VN848_10915 [Gemmatimonadales bacterium]|nr:hypothetical protein [Gemmatimonadales bacterium]